MKKTYFVGIDISKDHIDCALSNIETPRSFKDKKLSNDLRGFEEMEKWLVKNNVDLNQSLFCMEHTGTYGLLLFAWLSHKKVDYCVEPGLRIKRSLGMTRGKDDKIDARRIADYACTYNQRLKLFTFPSEHLVKIKQLLTYRDQLVRVITSFKNSIKSHKKYEEIIGTNDVTEEITEQIKVLDQKVSKAEKSILALINSDLELKRNFKLATSVKGIGLVIGAFLLVTTNNFSSFEDGRKYACYSGVAPFENSSGTSIRGKTTTSHLANKRIKTLLINGANSAATWDPEIKNYFKRRSEEGKDHKVIINAICCKLINRVFAVIKRQSPYVITYQQKVA